MPLTSRIDKYYIVKDIFGMLDSSSWRALVHFVDEWREISNLSLDHLEPWQIVSYTLSMVFFVQWIMKIVKYEDNVSFMQIANDIMIFLPGMQKKVDGFKELTRKEIEEKLLRFDRKKEFYRFLPDRGLSTEEIVGEASEYKVMGDALFGRGLLSGARLADNDENYQRMAQKIFDMYSSVNAIYPDVFPGCRKMEAEIIRMLVHLYHGGPKSCGSISISGTESILLACIAYRNRAFKLGIRRPEIVIAMNAHIGFAKAAKFLGMHVVRVPLNKNYEVEVGAMKRSISRETCMLVASMPSYVYGTMDSIEKISQLGIRYGIPVHVDACLGGFLLPFMEHCDFPVCVFDFRLSGVTSISVDLDKYAYCPIGSSAILYRDEEFFYHQCYTEPNWAGGVYVSPTISGNRPGSLIALTWATLLYNGRLGYIEKTQRIIDATRFLREKLAEIEDIEILGEPALSIIAFSSSNPKISMHIVGDEMNDLGWNLGFVQNPLALRVCIGLKYASEEILEEFVDDLKKSCDKVLNNTDLVYPSKTRAVYGISSSIEDFGIADDVPELLLASLYATPAQPQRATRSLSIEGRKMSLSQYSNFPSTLSRETIQKLGPSPKE